MGQHFGKLYSTDSPNTIGRTRITNTKPDGIIFFSVTLNTPTMTLKRHCKESCLTCQIMTIKTILVHYFIPAKNCLTRDIFKIWNDVISYPHFLSKNESL